MADSPGPTPRPSPRSPSSTRSYRASSPDWAGQTLSAPVATTPGSNQTQDIIFGLNFLGISVFGELNGWGAKESAFHYRRLPRRLSCPALLCGHSLCCSSIAKASPTAPTALSAYARRAPITSTLGPSLESRRAWLSASDPRHERVPRHIVEKNTEHFSTAELNESGIEMIYR